MNLYLRYLLGLSLAFLCTVAAAQEHNSTMNSALVSVVKLYGAYADVAGKISIPSSGTGTIISSNGFILTNAHVITSGGKLADLIVVQQAKDYSSEPEILCYAKVTPELVDAALDLAVIRCELDASRSPIARDTSRFTAMPLGDSSAMMVGEPLHIFGFPGLGGDTLTYSTDLLSGFVGEDGSLAGNRFFKVVGQVVSGGNSGGAARNTYGHLIGIPTKILTNATGQQVSLIRPLSLAIPLLTKALGDAKITPRPQPLREEPSPQPATPPPAVAPPQIVTPPTPATPSKVGVTISSNVVAELYVDQKYVGKTPKALFLSAGAHTIELRAPDHEARQESVEITDGEHELSFSLAPLPGLIKLDITPTDAVVTLDQKVVAASEAKVSMGHHVLKVCRDGFVCEKQEFNISANETKLISLSLKPMAKDWGSIRAYGPFPGVEVSVDGGQFVSLPTVVERLVPGSHAVSVRYQGRIVQQSSILIIAGETSSFGAEVKVSASLLVTNLKARDVVSIGARAHLIENGVELRIDALEPGQYAIDVSRDGCKPSRVNIDLGPGTIWAHNYTCEDLDIPVEEKTRAEFLYRGATVLPVGAYSAHGEVGSRYVGASFYAGVHPSLSVGATIRSTGAITELIARGRYPLWSGEQQGMSITVAADASLGLGFGREETRGAALDGVVLATLTQSKVLVSGLVGLQLTADQSKAAEMLALNGGDSVQLGARALLGLSGAYVLSKELAVEATIEVNSGEPRHIFALSRFIEEVSTSMLSLGITYNW